MNIMKSFKQLFLNGFFFLLPIAITFALFNFVFKLITSWLNPIRQLQIPYLSQIPYYEVILVAVFIAFVGVILKTFILKPLVRFIEKILERTPLIRIVYSGAKQLILAFTAQDQLSFKSVVMVEFPRPNMYSIGFLTSEALPIIHAKTKQKYFNIYIPTTPNPTTGYFVMIPEDEIIETDLTRQEAISLIISGGILQPDRYATNKKEEQ